MQLHTSTPGKRAVPRVLAALMSVVGAVAMLVPAGPAMANVPGRRQDTTAAGTAAVCQPGGYPGQPGMRVKSPNSDRVYLVDPDGRRRWIMSGYYFRLFRSWDGIQVIPDLHCMWEGEALWTNFLGEETEGSFLVKAAEYPHVYITDGSERRWIVPGAFDKYQFDWGKIRVWNSEFLEDVYPLGADWS